MKPYFEEPYIPRQFVMDRLEEICSGYCDFAKNYNQKRLEEECRGCPMRLLEEWEPGFNPWQE